MLKFAELSLLIRFRVWGVGVQICGCLEVRRMIDCVEGGFFMASRLGEYRCF